MARTAKLNGVSFASIVDATGTQGYLRTRSLADDERRRVATVLGISEDEAFDATLEYLHPELRGQTSPRHRVIDPLGWSSALWSTRCLQCHSEGRHWETLHQTGLAWICERHERFLSPLCGLCCPPPRLFGRANVDCHLVERTKRPSAAVLDLQIVVAARVKRANAVDVRWLRNLRAVMVVQALHAAAVAGGPRLKNTVRPEDSPVVNAGAALEAAQLISDSADVDRDWVQQMAQELTSTQWHYARLNDGRLGPIFEQIALLEPKTGRAHAPSLLRRHPDSADVPRSRFESIDDIVRSRLEWTHPDWVQPLIDAAGVLRRAGLELANVPALVDRQPLFDAELIAHLAPASALKMALADVAVSRAVKSGGGGPAHFARVTAFLGRRPSDGQLMSLREFADRLSAAPRVNYFELQLTQGALSRVPASVLRDLNLRPPALASTTAAESAAAWLWTVVTGSHPYLAPFLDGRVFRLAMPLIEQWRREAAPEGLEGLLAWNQERMLLRSATSTRTAAATTTARVG